MHFEIYNHWLKTDELLDPEEEVQPRGAAAASHPLNVSNLSLSYMSSIEMFLVERYANGRQVTLNDIRIHMKLRNNVNLSKDLIRRMLRLKGYRWRRAVIKPDVDYEVQKSRMLKYMMRYSAALNDPNALLVYVDESYVHQNHHANYGHFTDKAGAATSEIAYSKSRGSRFIILHAMTQHGLLHNATHPSVLALDEKTRGDLFFSCATAECVMKDMVSDNGDYHNTMKSEVFMAWVERRLIPAFQTMHPGKKMVLVLDNARYHHARTNEDETPPEKMNKQQSTGTTIDGNRNNNR